MRAVEIVARARDFPLCLRTKGSSSARRIP
jgi:hypothetical protein